MLRSVAATVAIASNLAPTCAHDRWDNGTRVPPWVRQSCCGVADIHHLRADQVHAVQGGYRVDGYGQVISQDRLQPAPDGEWWVFYADYPNGTQSTVYCFFGPPQSF